MKQLLWNSVPLLTTVFFLEIQKNNKLLFSVVAHDSD